MRWSRDLDILLQLSSRDRGEGDRRVEWVHDVADLSKHGLVKGRIVRTVSQICSVLFPRAAVIADC